MPRFESYQAKTEHARQTLQNGLDGVTTDPDALADFLRFRALFHDYSVRNTLLIQQQRPGARFCKGFKAWKQHGRKVKRGEAGLLIYAPIIRTLKAEPAPAEAGDARAAGVESGTRALTGYRITYVWDIGQTEPIPGQDAVTVPPLGPVLTGETAAPLLADLEAVAAALGWTVRRLAPDATTADGYCAPSSRTIGVRRAAPDQEAVTLAHELAHALAHVGDDRQRPGVPHAAREVQAEGAAFLACAALGLDTASVSLPYLAAHVTEEPSGRRSQHTAQAHLAEIDRIGWRLVALVEEHRHGPDPAPPALSLVRSEGSSERNHPARLAA